jgi:hypothetical protein
MKDLLKCELFKLNKNSALRTSIIVTGAVSILFAAIYLVVSYFLVDIAGDEADMLGVMLGLPIPLYGSYGLKGMPYEWLIYAVMSSILIGGIFASEHQMGIIRNLVMSGKPRHQIFLSKTIIANMAVVGLFLIAIFTSTVLGSIFYGWGPLSFGQYIGRFSLLLIQVLAFANLVILIASATKNTGAAIGLTVGMFFIFFFLATISTTLLMVDDGVSDTVLILARVMGVIGDLYPISAINIVTSDSATSTALLRVTLTSLGITGASIGLGMLKFQKEDLK